MFKKISLLLLTITFVSTFNAQERKRVKTTRIKEAPKIDGNLEDEAWKNASLLTNFVIFRPDNGKIVSSTYQTTVKVIYKILKKIE